MTTKTTPPRHLRADTRRWWAAVLGDYDLDPHHVRLLTLCAECWDRAAQARDALREGLTYSTKSGERRALPEVKIEHDAKVLFARLLRQLDLDVEPPAAEETPRQPALRSVGETGRRAGAVVRIR